MMEEGEEGESQNPNVTVRHIKKKALRNKGLSVSFNDKNLRDFVTGFHKRKKKRRLEAKRQLEEKERLKRIEQRKQLRMFFMVEMIAMLHNKRYRRVQFLSRTMGIHKRKRTASS